LKLNYFFNNIKFAEQILEKLQVKKNLGSFLRGVNRFSWS